jgi:heme/copper-type cytochrome/quinol oxidase subunit 3
MSVDNDLVSKHLRRPFSVRERGWTEVGLGVCVVLLSWHEYIQPSTRPFTGRWGWLKEFMYSHLGAHGVAVGFGLIGLVLTLWGAYEVATSRRNEAIKQS